MNIKVTDLTYDFYITEVETSGPYIYREDVNEHEDIKTINLTVKNPPCPYVDEDLFRTLVESLVEILREKVSQHTKNKPLVYYPVMEGMVPKEDSPYSVLYVEDENEGNHVEVVTTFGKLLDIVQVNLEMGGKIQRKG